MDDIFSDKAESKQKDFKQIVVSKVTYEALERLKKGSYNKAIQHLLNVNPDSKLNNDVKNLQQEFIQIQSVIERLVVACRQKGINVSI